MWFLLLLFKWFNCGNVVGWFSHYFVQSEQTKQHNDNNYYKVPFSVFVVIQTIFFQSDCCVERICHAVSGLYSVNKLSFSTIYFVISHWLFICTETPGEGNSWSCRGWGTFSTLLVTYCLFKSQWHASF